MFQGNGISFPPGAYAMWDDYTQWITVRNTKENLRKVEALIHKSMGEACSVQVITTLVEVADATLDGRFRDGTISGAEIKNFGSDQVRVLDSISVVTTSGSQSQTMNVSKIPGLAEARAGTNAVGSATAREVGTTLRLTPVVGADGRTIILTVIWEHSFVVGWDRAGLPEVQVPMPIIRSQNFTTSVVLDDGETLAFQVGETTTDYLLPPSQEEFVNRPQFLVLTARLIGTDRRPLPRGKDDESDLQPISAERVYEPGQIPEKSPNEMPPF
jgi:hypothetical protein